MSQSLRRGDRRAVFIVPCVCVVVCAMVLGCSTRQSRLNEHGRWPIESNLIAHAMGGIDGNDYLNCLECFYVNYDRGFRYFEADFLVAADDKLIVVHDGIEPRLGLHRGYTSSEYTAVKLAGRFTPLDLPRLAELLREKPDWFLITDVKGENPRALRELCDALNNDNVNCRLRLVPQIFSLQEIELVESLGFIRALVTMYRMPNTAEVRAQVEHVARTNKMVSAVAMPVDWWNPGFAAALHETGVQLFVHTVNDPERARQLMREGAAGVYTDFLDPEQHRR